MTRICWWLVDVASRLLAPDERDSVLGDFVESGDTGGQALCGLLGLIARRQAVLWKHWQPWLTLAGLVIPLAWLLSIASKLTADISAVYVWSYLNNWDWTLLKYDSFWYVLRDSAGAVLTQYAILVCWSWSAGFLLGAASRRIMPVNGVLFCVISVLAQLLGVSAYLVFWFQRVVPRPFPAHPDPVSALLFYRALYPLIVQAALVAVPAVWTMRLGAGIRRWSLPIRAALLLAAALTVVEMMVREPGLGFSLKAYKQLAILRGWPRGLLQIIVYWPLGYFAVSTIARRWHGRVREIF
jgi:hypothetical protein